MDGLVKKKPIFPDTRSLRSHRSTVQVSRIRSVYHTVLKSNAIILGAGMTGLSAGIATGYPVYEAQSMPGGICSSYYMLPGDSKRYAFHEVPGTAYRFEYGGGHWIFGGDLDIIQFIESFTTLKRYSRFSSVFLPDDGTYIPYPLQYHLSHLPAKLQEKALVELSQPAGKPVETMADWVQNQFGPTLNELFFAPFHELYTAGLWTRIRPQDNYKTPIDKELVKRGAHEKAPDVGYNAEFVYPEEGLDQLALRMSNACDVRFGKRANAIDGKTQTVHFLDGHSVSYDRLYSTLPLAAMVDMTGLDLDEPADPHTSVLVLNIGARKGDRCPDHHWVYVPHSRSGFHRVGMYSNVDIHFVPRGSDDLVGLYIERAFLPAHRPSNAEVMAYKQQVEDELREWGFIHEVEVNDATWVDVAYTWSWPGSSWIETALRRLDDIGITMLGRYGRWHFQGIAASIREGLALSEESLPFERTS